jgi:hypothetical protein
MTTLTDGMQINFLLQKVNGYSFDHPYAPDTCCLASKYGRTVRSMPSLECRAQIPLL